MDNGQDPDRLGARLVARREVVPDLQDPRPEFGHVRRLEADAQSQRREGRIRAGLDDLFAHGVQDRSRVARVRLEPDAPRLPGRSIGPFQRSPSTCPDFITDQEALTHQDPDVVQDRARVAAHPLRDLLVGHRAIEGQAQDPPAQRMPERAHLGRRCVAFRAGVRRRLIGHCERVMDISPSVD